MPSVQIGNTKIPFSIRESSKAKRMTIHLTPHTMEIVVPSETHPAAIEAFVERKRRWVYEKREELLERSSRLTEDRPAHYVSGAKIPYRGRLMKLVVEPTTDTKISIEYLSKFLVHLPAHFLPAHRDDAIRDALDRWIAHRVEQDCESFMKKYSDKLNVQPKGVRVKEQKHLWGSCGKDRIININWKLGRAPKKVLEYVVAHEVTHLRYRNHSDEFWHLLRSVFNEVDECRMWLEEHGGEDFGV